MYDVMFMYTQEHTFLFPNVNKAYYDCRIFLGKE